MRIKIKKDVEWDTEADTQSEAATAWLADTVRTNISAHTADMFGRPHERTYTDGKVIVTETQLYISNNGSWARNGVKYTVNNIEK